MSQDLSASRMVQAFQSTASASSQQMMDPTSSGQSIPASDAVSAQEQNVPEKSSDILSNQEKLALFESVLAETEAATQKPTSDQASQTQPGSPVSGFSKERLESNTSSPAELPGGMQYAETEPSPELSPEVEEYLQRVQEDVIHLPEEIVIAAQSEQSQAQPGTPQSVKVLPITKDQEVDGAKKSTAFSLRWLVEFSRKIAAMFSGKAVYRSE